MATPVIEHFDVESGEDASEFIMNLFAGMEVKYGLGPVVAMVIGRALFDLDREEFERCIRIIASKAQETDKIFGGESKLC